MSYVCHIFTYIKCIHIHIYIHILPSAVLRFCRVSKVTIRIPNKNHRKAQGGWSKHVENPWFPWKMIPPIYWTSEGMEPWPWAIEAQWWAKAARGATVQCTLDAEPLNPGLLQPFVDVPFVRWVFNPPTQKKRWSIRCGLVGDVQIFSRIIQAQWECQHRAISHINHGKRRENPAARCLESQLPAEVKTYYEENRNRCRDLGVDQQPAFPFQIDLEDLKNGRWIVFFWHKHAWTWSRWSFIQLSQVSWLHSISCYWI